MKRFISCMLCILLVCGALSAPAFAAFDNSETWIGNNYHSIAEVSTFTLGDINDDGSVTLKDLLVIRKYIADKSTEINSSAADIIADGKVSAKDLLALRKHFGNIEKLSAHEDSAIIDNFFIAGNDISEYCIVVPEGVTDCLSVYGNSADLFRKFVLLATGYNLKIDSVQTNEYAIRIVEVDEESELGRKLEIENYIYEVKDGDLYIYGTRRGSLYAVYDILEKYLGYRFFSNITTHQYGDRFAEIPEGTYAFCHPALDYRQCSQGFMGVNDAAHRYPRHNNGAHMTQHIRWGTAVGPAFINAHSYGYYWKMGNGYDNWDTAGQYEEGATEEEIRAANQLYAAKYASGYEQDEFDWNPCFVSDNDYEILFRGLLETMRYCSTWLNFYEGETSLSFSICDSYYLCPCTECKYLSKEGTMEIPVYGQDETDIVECLGGGGAAQCVYLANRGALDIQAYYEGRPASEEWYYDEDEGYDESMPYGMPIYDEYPGYSVYTILYDKTVPIDPAIIPEQDEVHPFLNVNVDYIPLCEHIILMYCGTACNNHYVGSYECDGNKNLIGGDGNADTDSLLAWGKRCHEVGAEMWYWYYPVNYGSMICDSPNITNIYHDIKFLVEKCYVNGVNYEGFYWQGYQFEYLKSHLAAEVMYSVQYDEDGNMTMMTEEEFHEAIKEYLYLYYGDGYEYVYQYLLRYEESSDALDTHEKEQGRKTACYVNNHDRPGDMFSYYYWQDNYLEMRELLLKAIELADTTPYGEAWWDAGQSQFADTFAYDNASQKERIEFLLIGCDTLGLSANCRPWWADKNATEENKAIYKENYTWLYNYLKETGLPLFAYHNYVLPETLDFDKTPLHAFNGIPSWNATDNSETWGASYNMPGWGTGGVEI